MAPSFICWISWASLGRIALPKLTGRDRFVEELSRLVANGSELRERNSVKLRIGQINLEIGETIGHGFRRGRERGAIRV